MKLEINYALICEPEDIPIKGNCSAIDPETDAAQEKWVHDQLESGNDWAWCCAHVIATVEINSQLYEGHDYLGGCSYLSEANFRECGTYDDMCAQAREDLLSELRVQVERGEVAKRVLRALEQSK